ncbi:MAG: pyruvate dehydrogenase [Bdellovibrio sp. CG10_big_fil_rev_8_21_14_0_10_47_8]|nr:MAG: pyruvate dehydrogenase [Bdellovibrio sp. CG10_big_fil_rev_8_21_14_0_10_47_8]
MDLKQLESQRDILNSVARRAHYLATQMIYQANHRDDKEKGDPKIGGHMSASASALHIMGALHLVVKTGFDFVANKPHASPTDHSYNYLMDLFLKADLSKLSLEDANTAMMGLRKFSENGEPVFQSYHSAYDCDHHNFFPSGTVGIPPVKAGYLALAYRFAKDHGYETPEAHFWAVCGDSEFREGSMYEAIPDFAEREIGNLTWIVDYNRQSLDGHRITNKQIMNGTDAVRMDRMMRANGWDVIQVQHGHKRLDLFARPGGEAFKNFLENELEDFEFQSLLLVKDMKALKDGLAKEHPSLKKFLTGVSDEELYQALRDLGGHDIIAMAEAMIESKKNPRKPTLIVAHTLKGWHLKMAAAPGNHSALVNEEELNELKKEQGIKGDALFERFSEKSKEGEFLRKRGEQLYSDIKSQHELKTRNQELFLNKLTTQGELPPSLEVSIKMASYPHTQWMLGQLTAKLTRIANTSLNEKDLTKGQKSLAANELVWKTPAELLVSMAPDVGTSTNLNPAMDGKIFGAPVVHDFEQELGVKDNKLPDLVPGEDISDRYIRFEIAEGNVMSCMGAFGKIRDYLGIPLMPLMTVYDFFIKRALDQYFYNLYWKSSFILVGTPSGVTLSPEGAQHGWKSDIQIPNQITWEPFYCQELDWILCDSIRRHVMNDNEGRSGVLIRGVTRGIEQKELIPFLSRQARFKQDPSALLHRTEYPMNGAQDEAQVPSIDEATMLEKMRHDVLAGGYYLIDYRGYAGYEPGDNVVHIFSMGSMTTEAIKASEALLTKGVYANVIVVTSPDLLCGIHGHENDYQYLREGLGINGNLWIHPTEHLNGHELVTVAGRRVPIVSVHDGEAGLLDNLGSIVGTRHECLAVRKHSKCGRPKDIYEYHGIDWQSVIEACGKVLAETALEEVKVSQVVLGDSQVSQATPAKWSDLWPTRPQSRH